MAKKSSKKKSASRAAAAAANARPAHWPDTVEGCPVIGEIGDTHWVVQGSDGHRHVSK